MGIVSETSLSSGPRWLVRREWRSHQAEYDPDDGEETAEEPAAQHPDEAALVAWLHEQPSEIKDSQVLRPGSQPCYNWNSGRGSCRFGEACHFRHDVDMEARPEYAPWLARRPPVAELRKGPEGCFNLTMRDPDRLTDELFDEMVADPIMRVALGLGRMAKLLCPIVCSA
jgi:hypothetical protein